MPRAPSEMLQGTVDVLILRTLSWQPMHGYGISAWVRERSRDVLSIEGAALYQALHRLERKRLIVATWGLSENNRKAKFYALTRAGKKRLTRASEEWQRTTDILERFLQSAKETP